ncbi:hypothetical protein [Spirosoma utsteinense]|uniref:Uncharacterized protein n=1 Tax=Spirosoma utsteinense TaxID=2585773 RepID=A0ABR6WD14_9BACT|nr:hypothetical protein [Spirosoma utsteinense]MBC3788480.1 hypothetical protein [Spirosoma utsteinense]MBC3794448.1 hypothetical protein [Spirosoma utsteinense]
MTKPHDPQSIGQLSQPLAAHAQRAGQTPPAQSAYADNYGKFVRQGATYTHVIRFAHTPKTTLIGYSRPRGGREKEDKVVLLQDIIRRLLASPKAYLSAGGCIEFYNNLSDDDRESIWIFTLHQSRAEPSHYASQLPWLMTYLEGLYKPRQDTYVQGLFTPAAGGQSVYAPPSGLSPTDPATPVDVRAPNLPLGANHKSPGVANQLSETRRFKDRLDLDDYLKPFLMAAIIPPGEIEGYRWKVIRNQHLPDSYIRH